MSHGGDGGGFGHGGGGHISFGGGFSGHHGSHSHGSEHHGSHSHGGEHHHYYDDPGDPGPFGYRSIGQRDFWRPRHYRSGLYINPGGCLLILVFCSIVGIFVFAHYWWAIIAGTILCIFALIAFLSRKPANTSGGYYQAPNQQNANPYYQTPGQYPPDPRP